MTFSGWIYLLLISLNTQNAFDFSCWSPVEIMRLFLHGCISYSITTREVQRAESILRVFQFFSKVLSRPASLHCSLLFHLLSLALTRFNSRHCSVFSTSYLASFLALGRGRSFAIFFATFLAVNSCSLLPLPQRLSFNIIFFSFGNLRREALIEAPSREKKKASGRDLWESHFHAGSALDSCQRCHFLLTNHKGESDLQFVDRAGWVSSPVLKMERKT